MQAVLCKATSASDAQHAWLSSAAAVIAAVGVLFTFIKQA
jgi:hypothetical protein